MSEIKDVAATLRKQFKPGEVGKLPRVVCPKCSDKNNRSGKCDEHEKRKCLTCGAYVSERHIHIDYVGHADVTSRLLEADPEWNWEPKAEDDHGLPVFDTDDRGGPVGLWIKLTVGGVTRLGYGSCPSGQNDAVKVLIGDALRNAAMRFGVALDLWAKGDRADPTAENATASGGQAVRRGSAQSASESFENAAPAPPRNGRANGHATRAEQPAAPQAPSGEPDEDAQQYADEAHEARTLGALKDIHVKAREAHKLAALIRNPATGGIGGLGQYLNYRKGLLERADKALTALNAAGFDAGLDVAAIEEKLVASCGHGIEEASAEEMEKCAAALREPVGAPGMTWLDETIKTVRDFDAARPRSSQAAVGWSEVGGCRSYLGFRLDGAWESDETDSWGAQRGTAIHEYLQGILAGPGVRTEVDTEYRGIPGHADLVDADSVVDIKSTKLANSKLWAADFSLLTEKRIQAHGYCAGLVDAGELPADATVRLLIIPVDGTFADWWAYEEQFDRSLADQGAGRLEQVRERMNAGEALPKDKPYAYCKDWCTFFSVCRSQDDPAAMEEITDPELSAAVAAYGEAHKVFSAAEKEKKRVASLIRGLRGTTASGWRISLGKGGDPKDVIDEDAVTAIFAARGEPVPMTTKPGDAPRLSVTKLKKAS